MSYVSFGRRQSKRNIFAVFLNGEPGATSFSHCGPYTVRADIMGYKIKQIANRQLKSVFKSPH